MQYCYHCMETIGTARICPHCGFRLDDYQIKPHHLCPGTLLRGNHYPIGKVLGEGGFGITYVGRNPLSEQKVAIKEFYMNGYVMRDHTVSKDLQSSGDAETIFRNNRDKFLQEARRLYKFTNEAGIVSVLDFFEENNTAYIVMDFIEGMTLLQYLKQHGKLSGEAVLKLLKPVFDSLAAVHEHGIIHRDISPDNIMLTNDGQVKLLDFGAAREIDATTHSAILKHGYAPFEQYQSKGNQGPWTDVYALCATIYHCITGIKPVEAAERVLDDPLVPPEELDCDCSKTISDALMRGMKIRVQDRYQNITELQAALYAKSAPPAPMASPETESSGTVVAEEILNSNAEPTGTVVANAIPNAPINQAADPVEPERNSAQPGLFQRFLNFLQTPEPPTPQKQVPQETAEEQYQHGEQYYYGKGVKQDYVKAVEWYQKSAEQGHAAAQYSLGICYDFGRGVTKDEAKAAYWYQKAAEQGYKSAQYNLGICYRHGRVVPEDHARAVEWYRKAAEQGHAAAQYNLGVCYDFGRGVTKDEAMAVKWYQKAAEQGDVDAQFNLAISYRDGTGIPKDNVKAAEWYRKAAEQGHKRAQYNLGLCYRYGRGVPEDHARAVQWYRKAAEQGHAAAQYNLGVCYDFGRGVTKDEAMAVKWYQKAAEQGDVDAQFNLAISYRDGTGIPKDNVKAAEWYRKAAEQGHAKAQYCLGRAYRDGNGVPKNKEQAKHWLELASKQGHEGAGKALQAL